MRRHWLLWVVLIFIVLPAGGFALYTWATLHITYSSGERTGYVQKISRKGWLCKTWEGELAQVTQPGVPPQIFHFSVRDDAVARTIEKYAGDRVALTYQQHKGVPTSCWGETEYYITAVQPLGR